MNLVIIGTGLAGYMLAKEWRKLNSTDQLIMISEDDGYYYSKPQLSLVLAQNKNPDALKLNLVDQMREELNATILTNQHVDKIDRKNKCIFIGDEKMTYDKLVLAVGAKHKTVPIKGIEFACGVNNLVEYETWYAQIQNAKNIIIIGSGLVGCEFANDLSIAGKKVTLISTDQFLMQKFLIEPVGRALENAFTKNNIDVILNATISEIKKTDDEFEVTVDDKMFKADCVLRAVGITPNCDLANESGLKCNDGICVDTHLQTSDDDVYALGDCAEVNARIRQYVQPILHGSRALAKTLNGERTELVYPVMPAVAKTSLCPIAFSLPQKEAVGDWLIDGQGADLKAEFRNNAGELQGFILSGKRQVESLNLVKELFS